MECFKHWGARDDWFVLFAFRVVVCRANDMNDMSATQASAHHAFFFSAPDLKMKPDLITQKVYKSLKQFLWHHYNFTSFLIYGNSMPHIISVDKLGLPTHLHTHSCSHNSARHGTTLNLQASLRGVSKINNRTLQSLYFEELTLVFLINLLTRRSKYTYQQKFWPKCFI